MKYSVLSSIKSPNDIKKLNKSELNLLCEEMRDCIIDTVSKNGGHLASNLGAVELTIALHRAFSSPEDAILFDVGHQCYPHKLITGRFDRFHTLRTEGGLSGFMRPDESEHDPFVTGHSSNSISAAYGIYKAKQLKGESGTAVAVIGDGAMTGGMAYEALNNAGHGKSNFIVVLNDNKMSISKNVGAIARSLTNMRNKPKYHSFKNNLSRFLLGIPFIGDGLNNLVYKMKEALKSLIYKNNFFGILGFNYLGPVDGHDIEAMESLFKVAKSYTRPSFVHIITTKGKGYAFAEESPHNYHGVSPFDIDSGMQNGEKLNFSKVAGNSLCVLAEKDSKICAITAAMTEGTGLSEFAEKYKNRFFDVGIAEQHAVTFAAGLAKGGMKPYFLVYSSFLQRGFDQIIHDVAIGGFPIRILVDRAGIVGEDGESHQGVFDVSYLTLIPNIEIYSPSSYDELEFLIEQSVSWDKPCAIRYPRGCEKECIAVDYTGDYSVVEGSYKKCIVTYGRLFSEACEAKKELEDISIIKLNKIYPLGNELINTLLKYEKIEVFEETTLRGGIGEHIAGRLLEQGYKGNFNINAVKNKFVPAARVADAIRNNGLDSEAMIKN